ncbi:MAG: aminoacyl-tRNA hydrolase [Spirochaetae bacterium HGW-Spirochaetae-6]|nr:MAG: aminoacyl-tRNA hydrolase [Spirochaetae bacterium HGW-Spirochaetae-6]
MKSSNGFLVVGLGNPGPKYLTTRHNVGFLFVEHLTKELNLSFKEKNNYAVAETVLDGRKLYIIKPLLYMNLSGIPTLHVASYYKIKSENILVAVDDVALPFGKIRIRVKGSSGGHNGIKSIEQQLGRDDFMRLRLGVGENKEIPLDRYVLTNFSGKEEEALPEILERARNAFWELYQNGPEAAMNKYNGN